MRLNKFVARSTGLSRRSADKAIAEGRVKVNKGVATLGQQVNDEDQITLDGAALNPAPSSLTIMLNKPAGYVCSRDGQGARTIYDLLPAKLQHLKPVGRLDKDSSGLLLLTNDGELAHQLTHPSFQKAKIYEVELDKSLAANDKTQIEIGVTLDDGPSRFQLQGNDSKWTITMREGRNRQIRRTFIAVGYKVTKLHRTNLGNYQLNRLEPGHWQEA